MPIFDQGYQHWSGTLTGHTWRWLTITRQGVRVCMKNLLLRIVVLLSWVPGAGLAFLLCIWGLVEQKSPLAMPLLPLMTGLFTHDVVEHARDNRVAVWTVCYYTFLKAELGFSMFVILLVGPGLISQDLRFNALPLYFSRPLRRIDYFLGKLGVIGWFLGMVVIWPSLLAYILGLMFSLDFKAVWDTFPVLLSCLAYGAVIVACAGTLVLAMSSLSRNSRYIALFWIAFWFVGGLVSLILNTANEEQHQRARYRKEYEMTRQQAAMNPAPFQPGAKPLTPAERAALDRAAQDARKKMEEEHLQEELRASQSNWRPLLYYGANLSRIGQLLLNTDAAWEKMSQSQPADERNEYLLKKLDPQFPWYWSAAVLAIFFGISVCTLNYRVRSLDRLK